MSEPDAVAKLQRGVIFWTALAIIQAAVFGLVLAHALGAAGPHAGGIPAIFREGGVPVGGSMPDVDGATLDGRTISLRRYAKNHALTAFLFFSRSCAPRDRKSVV
jgi:hypothetical protein